MIINFGREVYTVQKREQYTINIGDGREYPFISLDKDSYIVSSKIESGINNNWDAAIHSIQIGRYSALAHDIVFLVDLNHEYKSVIQGCLTCFRGEQQEGRIQRKGEIIIGHDCWVGRGATIMGGVRLGTGCVVGANAVVTKDVPCYAMVAGNPAKIVGYRFEEDVRNKLLDIRWWNWGEEQLQEAKDILLHGSIEDFISKYDIEKNRQEFFVDKMTNGERFVFWLDAANLFPVYKKVIEQYVNEYSNSNKELLIYFDESESNFDYQYKLLIEELAKYEDSDVYINIYTKHLTDIGDILNGANYYITSRSEKTVDLCTEADRRGISVVSAFNQRIFD